MSRTPAQSRRHRARPQHDPYPPIADYALIGDCHAVALVSRSASIDWCCMPQVDSDSVFGRLLDWGKGGYFSIRPEGAEYTSHRSYVEDTMVLQTNLLTSSGEVRVTDLFAMREGGRDAPRRQLIRTVEGVRGAVDMVAEIAPRFDYGEMRPWVRHVRPQVYAFIGGDSGLLCSADVDLEPEAHDLVAHFRVRPEERVRFSLVFVPPWQLDEGLPQAPGAQEVDHRIEESQRWWRAWAGRSSLDGADRDAALRSALVLKALTHAPTGAIAAAATTSLPETVGGSRNWDYRYSWIRDSTFSVNALSEIGYRAEAEGFRRFIQRSAAGSAAELQIMYGVKGERRLPEIELDLEGYRRSRPVRIGNGAAKQLQLDAFGSLVMLSWRWHQRGHSPDDDYWRFLVELVDRAAEAWSHPDRGIWEIRGKPRHFVHSKAYCWAALDRGLALADECMRRAPAQRWRRVAGEIKEAILSEGVDRRRGCFVQHFGTKKLDSALLLLPVTGVVGWRDELMVRTVDAIREDLEQDGLLLRYRPDESLDGQEGEEGTFLACTFWLAECLAHQGRLEEGRAVFERAAATANDVGLFAEEYDPRRQEMLGNFPQALSHLSHLSSAWALAQAEAALSRD